MPLYLVLIGLCDHVLGQVIHAKAQEEEKRDKVSVTISLIPTHLIIERSTVARGFRFLKQRYFSSLPLSNDLVQGVHNRL